MSDGFFVTVAAVFFANMLTVCFVWGLTRWHQAEQNGGEPDSVHLWAVILPLVFGGILVLAIAG